MSRHTPHGKRLMGAMEEVLIDLQKRGFAAGTNDKPKSRDTYKYQFKLGNRVVHGGITKDLLRREQEHRQRGPMVTSSRLDGGPPKKQPANGPATPVLHLQSIVRNEIVKEAASDSRS